MSTRLELVKKVAQKLGTEDPDNVTSTTSPSTDYQSDLVDAVDTAWEEIQMMHEGAWHWRREQKNFDTVASTREYTFADIDADCVGILMFQPRKRGCPYILTESVAGDGVIQAEIEFVPYQNWRGWLDLGTRQSGRPEHFTIRHDGGNKIEFDPTPNAVFEVHLDILHDVQELAADSTVPLMPPRFHPAIWLLACKYMSQYDENIRSGLFDRRYKNWLNDLRQDQLPEQRFNVVPLGS